MLYNFLIDIMLFAVYFNILFGILKRKIKKISFDIFILDKWRKVLVLKYGPKILFWIRFFT